MIGFASSWLRRLSCSAVLLLLPWVAGGCAAQAATSGAPASGPSIVGSWTIVGGDYPLTDEFRADGTLVQRVDGQTGRPMPYRIEGEHLVVSVAQPDGTVLEGRTRFEVKGDTLTFHDLDGGRRVFRRSRSGP